MADSTRAPGSVIEHRRATIHELRVEQRAAGDGAADKPPVIVGHAAVFDAEYAIGPEERPWFVERVARGAFLETIAQDDIRALFNHADNLVLGRNKAGTLKLTEDDVGLAVEIYPDMDSTQARDVVRAIQRGDVSQMSIGMTVKAAAWEIRADGTEVRTIQRVQLWDVSPVTFPASRSTEVSVRSAFPPAELSGYTPSIEDLLRRHDAQVTATLS
jgi:HK97 family phage prohead protease